jgi:hypothetical protein
LDILISSDNTDVYYKSTHTGQYTHFSSFEPFSRKTAWVKSLFHRASKLCSTSQLFENQVRKLKMFMSWNGFPRAIRNLLISNSKKNFLRINLALTFLMKTTLGLRFGYAFHTLVNKVKLMPNCSCKFHSYL